MNCTFLFVLTIALLSASPAWAVSTITLTPGPLTVAETYDGAHLTQAAGECYSSGVPLLPAGTKVCYGITNLYGSDPTAVGKSATSLLILSTTAGLGFPPPAWSTVMNTHPRDIVYDFAGHMIVGYSLSAGKDGAWIYRTATGYQGLGFPTGFDQARLFAATGPAGGFGIYPQAVGEVELPGALGTQAALHNQGWLLLDTTQFNHNTNSARTIDEEGLMIGGFSGDSAADTLGALWMGAARTPFKIDPSCGTPGSDEEVTAVSSFTASQGKNLAGGTSCGKAAIVWTQPWATSHYVSPFRDLHGLLTATGATGLPATLDTVTFIEGESYYSGQTFEVHGSYPGGTYVAVVDVPEPNVKASLLAGVGLLFLLHRKRTMQDN